MALHDHSVRWSGGNNRAWFDPWGLSAVALGSAVVAAFALLHHSVLIAAAFCFIPLVIWLAVRPTPLLFLLGFAIPWTYSLSGASGGLNVSAGDLLLTFAFAVVLAQGAATGSLPAARSLRPIAFPVGQFAVLMLLLVAVHFSPHDVLQTIQRYELFAFPLVVGAFAALTNRHLILLTGYVLSATLLGLLWPIAGGLGQKNPVGQMVGNAILVLVGVRGLRRYLPLAVLLTPALILTGSRGAILATAIGLLIVFGLQNVRAHAIVVRVCALVLVAFATYSILPVSQQQRLTNLSSGIGTPGSYAVYLRHEYIADAKRIIRAHPWIGIGVGNYVSGNPYSGAEATDPHNVVLLVAAEGGYVFAVSFILLVLGSAAAVIRMHRVDVAAAAGAVLAATVLHGLVDVYWVRGTPVLGWLLVGMTCGGYLALRERDPGGDAA
jgi:hypothetical protein